jgi:hypothetical protein
MGQMVLVFAFAVVLLTICKKSKNFFEFYADILVYIEIFN